MTYDIELYPGPSSRCDVNQNEKNVDLITRIRY